MKFVINIGFALMVLGSKSYTYANDRLIFAVDIVRHGDRNPGAEIPNSPYKWNGDLGELTEAGPELQAGGTKGCYFLMRL